MSTRRPLPASRRARALVGLSLLSLSACGAAAGSSVAPSMSRPPLAATSPAASGVSSAPAPVQPTPTPAPSVSAAATAAPIHPSPSPVHLVFLPPPTRPAPPGVQRPGSVGGCAVFPADNSWNQDISGAPVDSNSAAYIARIDSFHATLHPDFGSNPAYGIPYVVVPQGQQRVPINFTAYGSESDPGPYPVPGNAPVEQGSDAHVLVVEAGACRLYEMDNAHRTSSGWNADSGAVFDLNSDRLRPDRWTSADAAGLPILPGLVRYDEVAAGMISHALRFTVDQTQNGFIHPATHQAGVANAADPPMGARFRLKAGFDLSPFHGEALVILTALKRYGMIVADNGGSWFVSGATDSRWNDTDLNQLKGVPGSAFEAVETGPILR